MITVKGRDKGRWQAEICASLAIHYPRDETGIVPRIIAHGIYIWEDDDDVITALNIVFYHEYHLQSNMQS